MFSYPFRTGVSMKEFIFISPGHASHRVKGESLQVLAKEHQAVALVLVKEQIVGCLSLGPGVCVIESQPGNQ